MCNSRPLRGAWPNFAAKQKLKAVRRRFHQEFDNETQAAHTLLTYRPATKLETLAGARFRCATVGHSVALGQNINEKL